MIEQDPSFSRRVHSAHAASVRTIVEHLAATVSLPVRQRLLRLIQFFLDAGDRFARKAPGSAEMRRIVFPVKQRELAEFLATTPEHLCRTLKALESEGILYRDRGWLVVPDPQHLA